jgi:hypothetical protein
MIGYGRARPIVMLKYSEASGLGARLVRLGERFDG